MDNLPPAINSVTLAVCVLFSLFLIGLGVVSLLAPTKAKAFLLGFAASPFTHYLEMTIRLAVGGSILWQAPYQSFPQAFTVFGWLLIATSIVLLLLPWQWHRRFAEIAVPQALAYLPIVGAVSLAFGTLLLVSVNL